MKTNRVDVSQPNANMFGCVPCPKCHSIYRYPRSVGVIQCDDCGYIEASEDEEDAS